MGPSLRCGAGCADTRPMSTLSSYVESLKRAVAVPGTFATAFPNTTDPDLTATLADAMAEAQLDGYLSGFTLDLDAHTTSPDLENTHIALIVIYAAYRILSNEIRNRSARVRYEASGVVYETEQGASTLNELLRELAARKADLLEQARLGELDVSGVFMADLAFIKATSDYGWHSDLTLHEYEGI